MRLCVHMHKCDDGGDRYTHYELKDKVPSSSMGFTKLGATLRGGRNPSIGGLALNWSPMDTPGKLGLVCKQD